MRNFYIENKGSGEICISDLKSFKSATKQLKYFAWYDGKIILTKDREIINSISINDEFEDKYVRAWLQ